MGVSGRGKFCANAGCCEKPTPLAHSPPKASLADGQWRPQGAAHLFSLGADQLLMMLG